MPSTALFFLPLAPSQTSPTSTLISHITRTLPAEPLPPFILDHRLFVDTSSLLPNTDTSKRTFTSILHLSHIPHQSFIGTTAPTATVPASASQPQTTTPTEPSLTITSLPSSSTDTLTQLIGTKLQPQWAHRQSVIIDNGTSLSLHNGDYTIRLGDVKTSPRGNQPLSLRGMILELTYNTDNGSEEVAEASNGASATATDPGTARVSRDDETLLRGVVDALADSAAISLAGARVFFRRTHRQENGKVPPGVIDWDLVRLYMSALRGSRG
ncbi:hypothetical protein PV08_06014 [Exophiala spinifera]|uniref:Mediator of RNA polymerase II transcription subunit 20 n=1 Tax=Exophiala spinifera TaxID=91928 RepID=A0A0D2BXF9_9EURO|nr:uncharacterized protein PV08_06014 [Exophiala spinifera]KIW15964.1 hypothetical protein PV08_06014 [Exophiala spinifera]